MPATTPGRDRLLALAVWVIAAGCAAGAWLTYDDGTWARGVWLLALVAVWMAVFGWNLWTNRYSRVGDALIHAMGCNLPWPRGFRR